MKIIIHNPHALWFKVNLTCFFSKTKSIHKYDYLFDYLYKYENKVYVYIDNVYSSPLFIGPLKILNYPIVEFYAWVLLNNLNPFKFKIIFNLKNLNDNDIFLTFLYSTFIHADKEIKSINFINKIKDCNFLKVVHLSHFGYKTKLAAQLTKEANIDLFVSETNLSNSSNYFNYYFDWYKNDVYTLPFVAQSRFKKNQNFNDRINKVLFTGTNTQKMKEIDFIHFFKSDILQPIRSEIIEKKDSLYDYIDPLVNNLQVSSTAAIPNNKKNYFINLYLIFIDFVRLVKLFSKSFLNLNFGNLRNESNYYKVDIVEKYNSYKMFIVPEEIIGVPGIGFVEGMNCGAAYIGIDGPMYRDLGLIANKHFISYDGTIENLINVVKYYQNNQDELEIIALNGYQYAKENFNSKKVSENFLKKILNFRKNHND